jgi:hypothetical protein
MSNPDASEAIHIYLNTRGLSDGKELTNERTAKFSWQVSPARLEKCVLCKNTVRLHDTSFTTVRDTFTPVPSSKPFRSCLSHDA